MLDEETGDGERQCLTCSRNRRLEFCYLVAKPPARRTKAIELVHLITDTTTARPVSTVHYHFSECISQRSCPDKHAFDCGMGFGNIVDANHTGTTFLPVGQPFDAGLCCREKWPATRGATLLTGSDELLSDAGHHLDGPRVVNFGVHLGDRRATMSENYTGNLDSVFPAEGSRRVVAELMGVPVGDQLDVLFVDALGLGFCQPGAVDGLDAVADGVAVGAGIVPIAELAAFSCPASPLAASQFTRKGLRFPIRADDPEPPAIPLGFSVGRAEKDKPARRP